jgi:AcrR family transcriptional regulator/DNA-binding MarR family transcriptional regulator
MTPRDSKAGARSRAGADGARSGKGLASSAGSSGEGLPREHVSEIQRLRILTAMAEVAAERGAGQVTVAHVVARAGVSRRTFYDLFEDRTECFLAAFADAVAQAAGPVLLAYDAPGGWRERIRGALGALLVFFDTHPALARLCVVEALAAGPAALERRKGVLAKLVEAVDEGRVEVPKGSRQPPPLTADGVVGAVLAVIHGRLLESKPRPLGALLGELMDMIVLPYLGSAAARRELSKPSPLPDVRSALPVADPLEGLDMRITYRTVRVLIVIASNPGASNRQVAAHAGISDQGQVSKLLARLEHLGLARNEGVGPVKGAPNAWVLTAKGERVERAISVQTTPR